ncbi:c-type cytochrome [Lautropia mirabilis]|uniref:c-type cytochrome n=1 Tax=Lautropia mirabilis TaxID=47671 RepID=UPI0028E9B7F2|nr:c-type cytochrome [Lautropia mirabilis]
MSDDTFAPSSPAAPDAVPSRTPAQDKASAPQAIGDATALHVLKSNHCTSCHQPERKVVGPAFRDIRRRHAGQPDAGRQLAASILGGSSRNWGPVPMPPQPHVNDRDLKIIVDWIPRALR